MPYSTDAADTPFSRRDFIKTVSLAGAGVMLSGHSLLRAHTPNGKKRIAIVGLGSRSRMYQDAIQKDYTDFELVGVCDINPGRIQVAQRRSMANIGQSVPGFVAHEFDAMIATTKPDRVIVTTVDGFHHQYIIRAMELGCDVITEKPMTIDAQKCRAILKTQQKTGRQIRVTFNYRYSPPRTQVKELLMSGLIGEVLSVDFHWMLNTVHGADYFRRWHSQKKFSGGLLVHKATHHFDLVNWWLSAVPVSVYATGKREFYTPEMAKRFGLSSHHQRCRTCPEKMQCGFELDLAAEPAFKELYLDCEHYDGYYRDQCVFRPEIDIEDTMNVLVTYDNNVTLCYSLNAFNAWEGYSIVFNGTKGRLEHSAEEKIYISGTSAEQGGIKRGSLVIRFIPLRGPAQDFEPWSAEGGHGGGDRALLNDLFPVEKSVEKYLRAADHRAGAYSILIGAAANQSLQNGKPVRIADLVDHIDYPDYPPMPSRRDTLPMPAKI